MKEKQLKIAFDLVNKNLPLIPLKSNSKLPILKDWPDRGTLDKSQLNEWSTAYPDCNFGVITGNGLVVLDVDNKNNKEGSKVLSELGEIPQTFTVATPSGGFHYYFKSSVSLKSRNFNNGLEIKSTGNQVVAEGSTIDGKLYKVINDAEIAEFPIELIENLANLKNLNPVNRDYSIIRPVQWDEEQEKALQRQLDLIDPSLDYNSWLRVLFACLNIFGQYQDIITLLNKWSLNSIKYDKDEFWKKITSYNPNHHEKIGYPALKEIQWKYPKRLHPIARNDLGSKLELLILNRECAILEKYENKPSQQHKDALKEITTILAHGVDSNEQFRIAIPLETGMGKTTCVVALASELAQYDKGLLICAERIEQLADMQVDMINAGVSASKIGIYHKKHGTDIPSINFEEMQNYQYLLVSHARVQNDSQNFTNEKLLKYKNKKRCLTIWDESLITTESYYCSLPEMVCAIKDWLARFEGMSLDGKSSQKYTKEYELLNAHLQEVRALLEKEFDDGTVILLPYLSTELFNRNLINNIVRDESYRKSLETLITFIQLGEVRVVKAKDGSIIMQFVQRIADSFDKVIVMDASSRIRTLLSFDKTVSVLPLGINKYFNDVEIFHADVKSSKSSFIEDRFHLKNYLKELAHLIDNVIPKNEALIVFCHKDQKEEIRKWTERSYPLKEIHTLNWGEHRASNNYNKVKYVVTLGVMYRDWKEISSSIIAQTRSLNYKLLDMDVNETFYTEQAEMLYQGFSRGNCRNTIDGKAGKQTIYLFHPSEHYSKVMESLRKVMPNIKESKYKPKYLIQGRKNAQDYSELAALIIDYLVSLELEIRAIAKTALIKHIAPHLRSNSKTWRKAIKKVKYEINGWIFSSKQVIRIV